MMERRRIRGKTPLRIAEGGEAVRLRMMLREESGNLEDAKENAQMMFLKLSQYKGMIKKMEQEEQEILQTKIISPQEMVKDINLWDEATRSEMDSLLQEKKALKTLKPGEKEKLEARCPLLEVVPSKLVITRKAGGRRKVRIVAWGNFIPKKEEEDLFASGSDAVGLRVALKKGAMERWSGVSVDIKTAFLNAPLPGGEDGEGGEDEIPVVIKPPPILVQLGYVQEGEWWMALKAMHGLRQSPKVWGDHRDCQMRKMEWDVEGGKFWDGSNQCRTQHVEDSL